MIDHETGIDSEEIESPTSPSAISGGSRSGSVSGASSGSASGQISGQDSGRDLEDPADVDVNQILFDDLGEMTEGPSLPLIPKGSSPNPLFNSPVHASFGIPSAATLRPWSLNVEFEESVAEAALDPVIQSAATSDQLEWESAVNADQPGTIMPTEDEADLALSDEGLKQEIRNVPDRMAFKIGDVAHIVGVKTYVLRYWETEFEALKPKKSKFNQRMYTRRDVEILLMIKKLLYNDRFSIEGARLALRRLRKEVRADRQWDTVNGRIDAAKERLEDLLGDIREMKDLFLIPHPHERTGEDWALEGQEDAQTRTWKLLRALVDTVRVGDTEAMLHNRLKEISSAHQVEKMWHPAKLRCGSNSTKSFREVSAPDVVLKEGDVFFIDIGPVFAGYEGDAGATFVMGPKHASGTGHPLCDDVKTIWNRVARQWKNQRSSGPDLYDFARKEAEAKGWLFNLEGASGHRIGDFPHHVHWRGTLKDFKGVPSENLWILEIQIRDPKEPQGAFYEDILRCD